MDLNETEQLINSGKSDKDKNKKKFFERRSSWYIVAGLIAVLIFIIATSAGTAIGINDRVSLSKKQADPKIQAQLEGARLDIEEGRFEIALERLNWILDEMADFLSEEKLAEVGDLYSQTLVLISNSVTPTPVTTPTTSEPEITPTLDTRAAEELFNTAKDYLSNRKWNDVILTIAALREKNVTYRTVQVDGMLFLALRNRGVEKILAEGSLEPGIYDLTLSERFAPLDSQAEGIRTWTRLFLTGASYWGVDWSQVVYYFEQVYPNLPNLHDGTFMTARERFRVGAIEYAHQLAELGEYCEAHQLYLRALEIASDADIEQIAQQVGEACWDLEHNPPSESNHEGSRPTASPPPDTSGDITPTPEPSEEPTEVPTENPGG